MASGGSINFAPGAPSRSAEFGGNYIIAVVDRNDPSQQLAPVILNGNSYSTTLPISEERSTPMVVVRENGSDQNLLSAIPGRVPANSEVPDSVQRIVVRGVAITPQSTARSLLAVAGGVDPDIPIVTITEEERTSEIVIRQINPGVNTVIDTVIDNNVGGPTVVIEFANAVQTVTTVMASDIDPELRTELSQRIGSTPTADTVLNTFVEVVNSGDIDVRNIINQNDLPRSVRISDTVIDARSTENAVREVIINTINVPVEVIRPEITYASISPSFLNPEETITLSFTTNKPLLFKPRVLISGLYSLVRQTSDTSFTASRIAHLSDSGEVNFIIENIIDTYGNHGRPVSVTIDGSTAIVEGLYLIGKLIYNLNFGVGAGEYYSAVRVPIQCTKFFNTVIKYTLDGSIPAAANGTVYSEPLNITGTTTIKAVVLDGGVVKSGVISATYIIKTRKPAATTPVFEPLGSTYYSTQSVTINSATAGAIIKYTLDGSRPSAENGIIYSGPFKVTNSLKALAIAYKDCMETSELAVAVYTIEKPQGQAAKPTVTPAGGIYDSTQSVALSCATAGASIIYTLDGSSPSSVNGKIYTAPFNIVKSCVLKAIAVKAGMRDSEALSVDYNFNLPLPVVATPIISPSSSTFENQIRVEIFCVTPGVKIYYTLDGSKPSPANGKQYTGALTIDRTLTLSAIAVKDEMLDSQVASAAYTNTKTVMAPVFSLKEGRYNGTQSVALTSTTQGALIYYTLNGVVPSKENGFLYSSTIEVAVDTTIKAIAVNTGMLDSAVAEAKYFITQLPPEPLPVAALEFNPAAGTFDSTQQVEIICATPGATVYYTLDGSAPTKESMKCVGTITISASANFKAFAVKDGMKDSPVAEAEYVILIPVATPIFRPVGGTVYTSTQEVEITCATPGAEIYYTLDGSAPTKDSLKYENPVIVSKTTIIKAIAVKDGMRASEVKEANYPIHLPVSEPVVSVAGGSYDATFEVTIATNTEGAKIYYTIDGTNPTVDTGVLYTAPVSIARPLTIKAIAVKEEMTDSNVIEAAYIVPTELAATPVITPNGGFFYYQAQVTISCATEGSEIYYTKDGSAPSKLSAKYEAPFVINTIGAAVKIKAVAFKAGMFDSMPAVSNAFTISVPPPPAVLTLTAGSHGTAGNAKITGLTAGKKYIVKAAGGNWDKVDAGGKPVSLDKSGSDDTSMHKAVINTEALTGTEITGLTNGKAYSVYEVINAFPVPTAVPGAPFHAPSYGPPPAYPSCVYTIKAATDGSGLDLNGTSSSASNIAIDAVGNFVKIAAGDSGAAKISIYNISTDSAGIINLIKALMGTGKLETGDSFKIENFNNSGVVKLK